MSAHRVEKSGFRLRTPAKKRERWRRKGAAEEQEEKNDPNSLKILLHRQPRLISPLRRWLIKRSIRCTPLGASKYNFSGNPLAPPASTLTNFVSQFPRSSFSTLYGQRGWGNTDGILNRYCDAAELKAPSTFCPLLLSFFPDGLLRIRVIQFLVDAIFTTN